MARKTITQRIAFSGGKEMADQLKQIGDTGKQHLENLRKGSTDADSSFKTLQKTIQETGRRIAATGEQFKTFGRNMTLYVTTPLAAIAGASVKSFATFEKSISDISTLIDTNKESIDGIKNGILDLGKRTPVALGDLSSAMYQVRSAGIDAADSFKVLESAAKLGVAGLGTTREATDLLTSAINAFGLKGKDATDAANVLFTAVKNGKTTISELSQGFGNVAPIVESTGISFKEFVAAATALTGPGKKASESFTALRSALSGLTGQTADAQKLFDQLGVDSFQTLIKRSGGMVAAFRAIKDAAGDDQTALQKAVGGAEGLAAVLSLTGKQAKIFDDTFTEMTSSVDNLSPAFEKQAKTLDSQFKLLGNAVQELGISLGTALSPVVTAITNVLRGLAETIDKLPGPVKAAAVGFAALLAAIGPMSFVIGSLVTSWGRLFTFIAGAPALLTTLVTGVKSTVAVIRTLRVAILAAEAATGPWGLAIAAIGLALGALVTYFATNEGALDEWKTAFLDGLKVVTDAFTAFEDYLKGVWDNLKTGFNDLVDSIVGYFKGLYTDATGILDDLYKGIKKIIDGAKAIATAITGGDTAAPANTTPGFAGGGHVRGPGSGTSDSILARLSNGEFIQRAAAVRYYGRDFMDALNRLAIPRSTLDGLRTFANGGFVNALSPLLSVPGFAMGGLVDNVNSGGGGRPILLQIGTETIGGITADAKAVDRLQRVATRKATAAGGVKPSWYYR